MRKWYFETFKRLADNIENRYLTHEYINLNPNKRKTWFGAYLRISKTIYRDRVPVDKNWRDFCRKLLSRYYKIDNLNEWNIAVNRLAGKKFNFLFSENSNTIADKIVKKLEKKVFSFYKVKLRKNSDYNMVIKSIARKLNKISNKNYKIDQAYEYKISIDILIRKFNKNYSYVNSLELIAMNKIENLNRKIIRMDVSESEK